MTASTYLGSMEGVLWRSREFKSTLLFAFYQPGMKAESHRSDACCKESTVSLVPNLHVAVLYGEIYNTTAMIARDVSTRHHHFANYPSMPDDYLGIVLRNGGLLCISSLSLPSFPFHQLGNPKNAGPRHSRALAGCRDANLTCNARHAPAG